MSCYCVLGSGDMSVGRMVLQGSEPGLFSVLCPQGGSGRGRSWFAKGRVGESLSEDVGRVSTGAGWALRLGISHGASRREEEGEQASGAGPVGQGEEFGLLPVGPAIH